VSNSYSHEEAWNDVHNGSDDGAPEKGEFVRREVDCKRCYGSGQDDDGADCLHCQGYGTNLV